MSIKKIIKYSFILITILTIILAFINTLVIMQINDNNSLDNDIHDIVTVQSKMAFSLKESIKIDKLDELNIIKKEFILEEKRFEAIKDNLVSNDINNFLDLFIDDNLVNPIVNHNLELLFRNEKLLENLFDQVVSLQKEKFKLIDSFNRDYPEEKILRKQLQNEIFQKGELKSIIIFGDIKYYSKETLFQHRNNKYLNKWLTEIEKIKVEFKPDDIDKYINVVKRLGSYILKIEEIKILESKFEREILSILRSNQKVNDTIVNTIVKLSSSYIGTTYLIISLLALLTIGFIITLAYKVYVNVGWSVDEIEQKVQISLREIKKLNTEIEITQKEVVFTMGAIGESRSKETGNHVKRVAEYSKLFALYYGLPREEAEMLKQASPMHDIGKVAIPDSILNKPGKLTSEEFKIMKTHAELGYKMLNNSDRPLLKMASIVAYEHHEKWDGTGYPQGTEAENINIYGRITAIADVFDALGSDRIYKKAWNDKSIFEFFKAEKGKHFDPKLVEIFFDHLDEFLTIRKKLRDDF